MQFVIPPSATAAVPVVGTAQLFPVHRIYCVGRNYADHAKEMGATGREEPFFFMKPADAVLPVASGSVGDMPYPPMTADLQHEIELVAAIGRGGRDIAVEDALTHVWGYAVGLDMTRRDLQGEAKKQGRPWCTGKGFDHSAPIGPIHPAIGVALKADAAIHLNVNGQQRQHGEIGDMIWNVAETIAYLSGLVELFPGDLIYTGTPEGVGAVVKGDLLEGHVDGLPPLSITIG